MKRLSIIASLLILSACDQPHPTPPAPRPALVMTVGDQTTAAPTLLIGEVRSRFENLQGFRIAGKIIERRVDIGQQVKKGQLLAKLDDTDTILSSQAANADVRAAQADLMLAEAELNRYQQLHQRQFVSSQALDTQQAKFKAAAAKVKQVKAQAAVTGNQSRYTELLAERDGVITDIRAEPGQVVEAGEQIARIAAPEYKEVLIAVPESRMNGIDIGTPAEVRLWADSATVYPAKVREIAPAADNITRTFQLRLTLADVNQNVRLGMTAGVRFYHQDSKALLLPNAAVSSRDGQAVVWVFNPSTAEVHPKTVKTGVFREDGVIITQGLNTGEQVVIAGIQALVPGQVVRPQAVGGKP